MKCLFNIDETVYTKCPYKHFLLSLLKKKKEYPLMFLGNFPSHLHIDYKIRPNYYNRVTPAKLLKLKTSLKVPKFLASYRNHKV